MTTQDTDTGLHNRWALACGATESARLGLVTYLVGRIQQPSIESQTTLRAAQVMLALGSSLIDFVRGLEPAEVAAWLAHANLGPSFERWAMEHDDE